MGLVLGEGLGHRLIWGEDCLKLVIVLVVGRALLLLWGLG